MGLDAGAALLVPLVSDHLRDRQSCSLGHCRSDRPPPWGLPRPGPAAVGHL